MNVTVKVVGDKELARKLSDALYAQPVHRFFGKSGFAIQGRAQDNAPRWDENLVNSLQVERDIAQPERFVRVGTNAEYAAPVEEGSRPHWAPLAALTPWAVDHDIEPFALQRHIAVHGTRPHPFLRPALDDSEADIKRFLSELGDDIERQATA